MKYKIKEKQSLHEGFVKLYRADVEFDSFEGQKEQRTFEVVDRGDSAAVVLFERDTNTLLLANQFRLPTVDYSDGWTTELVAGRVNPGEDPEAAVRREVEEEIGYKLDGVKKIGTYVLSPGACTERVFLYFGKVESTDGPDDVHEGMPGEDIRLVRLTLEHVEELISKGDIFDAKTVIGLRWVLAQTTRKG